MEGLRSAKQFYKVWRLYSMYKETMGLVKGIGIGVAAAAAVAAVGSKMMKENKQLRRSVHRAMNAVGHAAGDVVGTVESLFK